MPNYYTNAKFIYKPITYSRLAIPYWLFLLEEYIGVTPLGDGILDSHLERCVVDWIRSTSWATQPLPQEGINNKYLNSQ